MGRGLPQRRPNLPFCSSCRPSTILPAFGTLLAQLWFPLYSMLGAFWSPLGSILLPLRCPLAPISARIQLLPYKPCAAYSDDLLVHTVLLVVSFRCHFRLIFAPFGFHFRWRSVVFSQFLAQNGLHFGAQIYALAQSWRTYLGQISTSPQHDNIHNQRMKRTLPH